MLVRASEARQVPRSVLEAKPVEECFAAAILWRVFACDPLAPLAGSEADECGVVLVPFDDPQPEVARPPLTHRGVRLEQLVQPIKADPSRCWVFARVPGRKMQHCGLSCRLQCFSSQKVDNVFNVNEHMIGQLLISAFVIRTPEHNVTRKGTCTHSYLISAAHFMRAAR